MRCASDGAGTHTKLVAASRKRVRAPVFVPMNAIKAIGNIRLPRLGRSVGTRVVLNGACRLCLHPKLRIVRGTNKLRGFGNFSHPVLASDNNFRMFSLSNVHGLHRRNTRFHSRVSNDGRVFAPRGIVSVRQAVNTSVVVTFSRYPPKSSSCRCTGGSLKLARH